MLVGSPDVGMMGGSGGAFVAVVQSLSGSPTDKCLCSFDAINWQENTMASSQNWLSIAWNGSVFCAIGATGTGQSISSTSPDGITWTDHNTLPTGNWASIAWNGSLFCIVGREVTTGNPTNTAATSADGITWATHTMSQSASWGGIVWCGTFFLAVDTQAAPTKGCTSSDGTSWTNVTLYNQGGSGSNTYQHPGAWNGSVVSLISRGAFGDTPAAAYSSNGSSWSNGTHAGTNLQHNVWMKDQFFTWDTSGNLYSSTDGTSYLLNTTTGQSMSVGAFNGAQYCILGNNRSTYSANGIDWTVVTPGFTTGYVFSQMAASYLQFGAY